RPGRYHPDRYGPGRLSPAPLPVRRRHVWRARARGPGPASRALDHAPGCPRSACRARFANEILSPGERLLLCSDGLWNYAPTPSALMALTSAFSAATPAITVCQALIKYANGAVGRQNVFPAMSRTPGAIRFPGARIDQHRDEILEELRIAGRL